MRWRKTEARRNSGRRDVVGGIEGSKRPERNGDGVVVSGVSVLGVLGVVSWLLMLLSLSTCRKREFEEAKRKGNAETEAATRIDDGGFPDKGENNLEVRVERFWSCKARGDEVTERRSTQMDRGWTKRWRLCWACVGATPLCIRCIRRASGEKLEGKLEGSAPFQVTCCRGCHTVLYVHTYCTVTFKTARHHQPRRTKG
jgi:hypothetical protein